MSAKEPKMNVIMCCREITDKIIYKYSKFNLLLLDL